MTPFPYRRRHWLVIEMSLMYNLRVRPDPPRSPFATPRATVIAMAEGMGAQSPSQMEFAL